MKPVGRFSKMLGYFVAAAAMLAFVASVEATPQKAQVRAVRGSAQVSLDKGQTWKSAKVGMSLNEKSLVKTAPSAQVDLFLGDNGPVVRVTEDTTLGIDKLDMENTGVEKIIETQLDLKNGRILGNVKKLAASSKYEVKTPVGVAAIRGTEYDIRSDGRISVVSGTVVLVIISATGVPSTITINAGQSVTGAQVQQALAATTPQVITPVATSTLPPGTAGSIPPGEVIKIINIPGGGGDQPTVIVITPGQPVIPIDNTKLSPSNP